MRPRSPRWSRAASAHPQHVRDVVFHALPHSLQPVDLVVKPTGDGMLDLADLGELFPHFLRMLAQRPCGRRQAAGGLVELPAVVTDHAPTGIRGDRVPSGFPYIAATLLISPPVSGQNAQIRLRAARSDSTGEDLLDLANGVADQSTPPH